MKYLSVYLVQGNDLYIVTRTSTYGWSLSDSKRMWYYSYTTEEYISIMAPKYCGYKTK